MRMMHRAALLNSYSIPLFSTLFGRVSWARQGGRSSATEGAITFTPSFEGVNDPTWYLFFAAGSCLEISRVDVSSGVMTKTRLKAFVPEGDPVFLSELNQAGTSIVSDSVYSGNMTLLSFSYYSPETIDKMFQNCTVGTLLSYYDSALTDAAGDLRVVTSRITSKSGVVLASYRDVPSGGTAGSVFCVASTGTPTSPAENIYTEGSNTYGSSLSFLQEITTSGVSYIIPRRHDVSASIQTARVRSYTLKYLKENW